MRLISLVPALVATQSALGDSACQRGAHHGTIVTRHIDLVAAHLRPLLSGM